jgi:hypothetical protein
MRCVKVVLDRASYYVATIIGNCYTGWGAEAERERGRLFAVLLQVYNDHIIM